MHFTRFPIEYSPKPYCSIPLYRGKNQSAMVVICLKSQNDNGPNEI